MKRAAERTIENLKDEIEVIARDKKLNDSQKTQRILDMGKPTPQSAFQALDFAIEPRFWDSLKQQDDFWEKIAKIMDGEFGVANNYFKLDQQGKSTFGLQEIANVIGTAWFYQLAETTDFNSLNEDDQRRKARSEFVTYMKWFDSEASIQFLVFYARYLNITRQLVDLNYTKQHKKAPRPLFKETVIPPPQQQQQRPPVIPIPVRPQTVVQERPLYLKPDEEFYVNTSIMIAEPTFSHRFILNMKKEKVGQPETRVFDISLGGQNETVPTFGIITRVLKFVVSDRLYIIISGPRDSTLIRILYFDDGFKIQKRDTLFFPRLDPDLFDDITYHSTKYSSRVARNLKSVASLDDLLLFDISALGGRVTTRDKNELSAEEAKKFTRQSIRERMGGAIPLTDEEKVAYADLLKSRGQDPVDIQFVGDIQSEDEIAYVRRQTGYIFFGPVDDLVVGSPKKFLGAPYENLWVKLMKPLVPIFKPTRSPLGYQVGDDEILAAKVIRVPHEIYPHFVALAVLARKHTGQRGPNQFTTQLHLFKYRRSEAGYEAGHHHVIDLENFLLPSGLQEQGVTVWRDVKEFNIVFHDTPALRQINSEKEEHLFYFFYVEVMQATGLIPDQVMMRNSSVKEYDFVFNPFQYGYAPSGFSPETSVKDFAIVNTLARNGYKIYDFRHDVTVDYRSKFDAIYYKYDYGTEKAKIILYKAQPGRAAIADIIVGKLTPGSLISISPMQPANNLASIQVGKPGAVPRLYRLTGKEALLVYDDKYSLASQFQANLTLSCSSNGMDEESSPFCALCGDYTSHNEHYNDNEPGYFYCDEVCKLLFSTTNTL